MEIARDSKKTRRRLPFEIFSRDFGVARMRLLLCEGGNAGIDSCLEGGFFRRPAITFTDRYGVGRERAVRDRKRTSFEEKSVPIEFLRNI